MLHAACRRTSSGEPSGMGSAEGSCSAQLISSLCFAVLAPLTYLHGGQVFLSGMGERHGQDDYSFYGNALSRCFLIEPREERLEDRIG
eukprot:4703811-Amphidinium_carterae.2